MAEKGQQSRTEQINKWVQTSAIIIAALWGIWTFVFKEVWEPKSAPVNITIDLGLKKAGESSLIENQAGHALIPVEMKISAKNPSSRQVFLLPNFWFAIGVKVTPSKKERPFSNALTITADNGPTNVERHAEETAEVVVGYGSLLQDTVLKPNETATRTLIFYVPPKEYDSVRVIVGIPTMDHENAAQLEYTFNEQDNSLNPKMYRIGRNGERIEMKHDKNGAYSDRAIGLQTSGSQAELSLR